MKGEFVVENQYAGKRLDILFSAKFPEFSRSHIKKLIDDGRIRVGEKAVKCGEKLKEGWIVSYDVEEAKPLEIKPQKIDFEIVFEDEDLLVVNKPQGLVVHPCSSSPENTLVNGLLFQVKDLSGINGVLRPGIVHRLDKNTSGLMIVAKNDFAHKNLAEQIKNKICHRIYYALCDGEFKATEGTIESFISRDKFDRKKMSVATDGKWAVTDYKVLKYFKGKTLVEFSLKTGRTHQIRVHCAQILHHPIVGDDVYGKVEKGLHGQLLHSKKIEFLHPKNGEKMTFEVDLPVYFKEYLEKLTPICE